MSTERIGHTLAELGGLPPAGPTLFDPGSAAVTLGPAPIDRVDVPDLLAGQPLQVAVRDGGRMVLVDEAGGRCLTLDGPDGKLGLVFGSPALVDQLADFLPPR